MENWLDTMLDQVEELTIKLNGAKTHKQKKVIFGDLKKTIQDAIQLNTCPIKLVNSRDRGSIITHPHPDADHKDSGSSIMDARQSAIADEMIGNSLSDNVKKEKERQERAMENKKACNRW